MSIPNEINKIIKTTNFSPKKLKTIEYDSMGDDDINAYFPKSRIITYPELKNVSNIEELLPKDKDHFFLLYLQQPNSGHWTMCLNNKGTIEFFCSYGSKPSTPLEWSKKMNRVLGQEKPYLDILLSKTNMPVVYNHVDYQNKKNLDISTCGRHCCFRLYMLLKYNKSLNDYYQMMKNIKNKDNIDYDQIVSENIDKC
jgi:hypothetical protein